MNGLCCFPQGFSTVSVTVSVSTPRSVPRSLYLELSYSDLPETFLVFLLVQLQVFLILRQGLFWSEGCTLWCSLKTWLFKFIYFREPSVASMLEGFYSINVDIRETAVRVSGINADPRPVKTRVYGVGVDPQPVEKKLYGVSVDPKTIRSEALRHSC